MAATLGLGRTTVLEILNAAGVEIRPQGRKYQAGLGRIGSAVRLLGSRTRAARWWP